jgi:hypothetical protein
MPWYRLLDLAGVSTLEESALWRGPDVFPLSFLADVVKKGRRTALRRGSNLGGWGRLMLNFMATLIVIMKSSKKRGQRPTRPCMDRAKVCQEYSHLQDWWGFLERVNALASPKCLLHYPSEASRPRMSTERPHSKSTRPLSTIGERFGVSRDIRALHFYFYPREHRPKLQAPYFGAQPCSRRCWRLRIRMLCGMHSQANHHYHAHLSASGRLY